MTSTSMRPGVPPARLLLSALLLLVVVVLSPQVLAATGEAEVDDLHGSTRTLQQQTCWTGGGFDMFGLPRVGQYRPPGFFTCQNCRRGFVVTTNVPLTPADATSESQCYCRQGGFAPNIVYYFYSRTPGGCVVCHPRSTNGSTDGRTCECATGFQNWNPSTGACVAQCPSGQYWSTTGGDDGKGGCVDCSGDVTLAASTDFGDSELACFCKPRTPTRPHYVPGLGCTDCVEDDIFTGNSADGRSCDCKPGYEAFKSYCVKICPPGFFRTFDLQYDEVYTISPCTPCAGEPGVDVFTDTSGLQDEASCYAKPGGELYYSLIDWAYGSRLFPCDPFTTTGTSADGRTCTCKAGYEAGWDQLSGTCFSTSTCTGDSYWDGTECAECAGAGATTNPDSGQGAAVSVMACSCIDTQQYYALGSLVGCQNCPASSTSVQDIPSLDGRTCECKPGYALFDRVNGACSWACPHGYANVDVLDGMFYGCFKCATGNVETEYATAPVNSTSESACFCKPIQAGTPRTSFYRAGVGCTECLVTATTTGFSVNGRTCECRDGYTGFDPETRECRTPCGVGSYYGTEGIPDPTNDICVNCFGKPNVDVFTNATEDQSNESACYALKGGKNWYRLGFGVTPCEPHTTTGTSADGKKCDCKTGFRNFDTYAGTCYPTKYCDELGQYWDGSTCTPCADGATTEFNGAFSPDHCVCLDPSLYYSTASPQGCKSCPTKDTATVLAVPTGDGKTCLCRPGYGPYDRMAGVCNWACTNGRYFSHESAQCEMCLPSRDPTAIAYAPDVSWSESACACQPAAPGTPLTSFYKRQEGCTPCPNTTTTIGLSPDGKTCACRSLHNFDIEMGTCRKQCTSGYYYGYNPGSTDPDNPECTACIGKPGDNVLTNTTGDQFSEASCYAKRRNQYYVPGVGVRRCDPDTTFNSTTGKACQCKKGFRNFNPDTGACSPTRLCKKGTYWDTNSCVKCGTGATTASAGSYKREDCFCTKTDMYHSTASPMGCKACPTTSTATVAAGPSTDGQTCSCKPGYDDFDRKTATCDWKCTGGWFSAEGCKLCVISDGAADVVTPTAPVGATSELDCTCPSPKKATTPRQWYQPTAGCQPCPKPVTDGRSPDGKVCKCSYVTSPPLPFNQLASADQVCCTPLGAKCGTRTGTKRQPRCCAGLSCTGATAATRTCQRAP